MPLLNVSGTVGGTGELLELDPLVTRRFATSSASGSGDISGTSAGRYIFSGYTKGAGGLLDPWVKDFAGTASGSGALQPATLYTTVRMYGLAQGRGDIALSGYPLTARGAGDIRGYLDIVKIRVICTCGTSTPQIGWGDSLSRGDLTLCLKDFGGNPITPYCVWYTLYRMMGQFKVQVGANRRTPISPQVGEFYAVFTPGDEGQPGDWIIQWNWQFSASSLTQSFEYHFKLLDAASAMDPNDLTPRCKKYGWSD